MKPLYVGPSHIDHLSFLLNVNLQCVPIQRRIAEILGRYDEVMGNYQNQISTLEGMAQELYREWFVRRRCPYAEPGEEGGLPIGWEKKLFKDFVQLKRGYDLPDSDMDEGIYPVLASTSIKGYHSSYKVEPPCITTGRSGSLGTVLWVNKPAWPLNTSLYVKDFKGNSPYFIYYRLQEIDFSSFNSGAGVPTLNQNHLHIIEIIVPSAEIQQRFENIISSIFNKVENLQTQLTTLRQTRDKLLSRLLSGQVEMQEMA